MSEALIIRDDGNRTAGFTEAALQLKASALEAAGLIGTVTNPTNQAAAVAAMQGLAHLLSQAEKARKACKEPVLEFGRDIDAKAKEFTEEPRREHDRIAAAVSEFQEVEAAKARAAEQAKRLEAERIERERREAELKAIREAQAERLRLEARQQELNRLSQGEAAAVSHGEKRAIQRQQVELNRQKALAEAKSHDQLDRINEQASQAQAALSELPQAQPARANGQRVRSDFEIEIVDLWTLARAHPACVTITPRIGEIKDLLNVGVKVAGVRAKPILKSSVTVPRGPAAINV